MCWVMAALGVTCLRGCVVAFTVIALTRQTGVTVCVPAITIIISAESFWSQDDVLELDVKMEKTIKAHTAHSDCKEVPKEDD